MAPLPEMVRVSSSNFQVRLSPQVPEVAVSVVCGDTSSAGATLWSDFSACFSVSGSSLAASFFSTSFSVVSVSCFSCSSSVTFSSLVSFSSATGSDALTSSACIASVVSAAQALPQNRLMTMANVSSNERLRLHFVRILFSFPILLVTYSACCAVYFLFYNILPQFVKECNKITVHFLSFLQKSPPVSRRGSFYYGAIRSDSVVTS